MDWFATPQAWIGLCTLTILEIVLGIDNIVFISILAGRLPPAKRTRARLTGMSLAMFMRILLLLSISWIMRLTHPLLAVAGFALTGRALILVADFSFWPKARVRSITGSKMRMSMGRRGPLLPSLRF